MDKQSEWRREKKINKCLNEKRTEIWWRIVVTSLWRLEWFNWAQGILGVKVPHKHKYTLVEMNISAKRGTRKQEQILKSSMELFSFYEYDNLYVIGERHFTLCLPTKDVFLSSFFFRCYYFTWVVAPSRPILHYIEITK